MKDNYDSTGAMASAWSGTSALQAVNNVFGNSLPGALSMPSGITWDDRIRPREAARLLVERDEQWRTYAAALCEQKTLQMRNALEAARKAIHRADMGPRERETVLSVIAEALQSPTPHTPVSQAVGRLHRPKGQTK